MFNELFSFFPSIQCKKRQKANTAIFKIGHCFMAYSLIYQKYISVYKRYILQTLTNHTAVSIANLGRLSRKKKKQKLTQPPSWSTLYPRKRKLRFHVKMPKLIIFLSRCFFFFNANCVQDFHTFTLTNYTSNRSGIYQGHRTSVFCSISVVRSKK